MGQCYSVYLKVKLRDADAFVRLTREFVARYKWPKQDIDRLTGIDSIINCMISSGGVDSCGYEDGWPVFRSDFDASYSWDGVMEEWFRAVAPSLVPGSEIEVWPDSGSWKCTVKDGGECDKEVDDGNADDEDDEI